LWGRKKGSSKWGEKGKGLEKENAEEGKGRTGAKNFVKTERT